MTTPLELARALRDLIESESDAIEKEGTMTAPVVDALDKSGLFRLLVPKAYGGMEADVDTIFAVAEELSYADGSVGWSFSQNTTCMALAAYLAPDQAQRLSDSRAAAGMFAPLGMAEKTGDTYKISGNYAFGSGSGHADYIGGGALVMENGEMVMGAKGIPVILGYMVPMGKARLKGNWDVMGLSGTGSYDFEIPEQSVEAGATFSVFGTETIQGGPLYGLGSMVVGTLSSVAWALGVACRAMDEVAAIAKAGRARLGQDPLAQQQIFQRDFGTHMMAIDAGRLLATNAYNKAVEAIGNNAEQALIDDLVRDTKAASSYAVKVAKEATNFAWEAAGSGVIRKPGKLERCFRDMAAGAGHQVFDQRNYIEVAKKPLGQEPLPY
ncbi:MAG: acyl-CoA dehydrogenase family protein [Halioglobus sp.]